MDRETIELVTPVGGHKVVIKAWLSGRERRNVRSVYLENVRLSGNKESVEDKEVGTSYDFEGSIVHKLQDVAIQNVVLSVDGHTDNLLDRVLDMRDEDTNFVIDEINKITESVELPEEAKKK